MIYKENKIVCVDDLSKEFNKSKATIYKKLKSNKELRKPILRKDRKTYISAEAVQWLQEIYSNKSNDAEEKIENTLNYKNIEENKKEQEKTIINTNENMINSNLDDNLVNNEIIKKEENKDSSLKDLASQENTSTSETCTSEACTLDIVKNMENNNEPVVLTNEKTPNNIINTEEAVPTTEFSSKERIPLSLDNEVFGLLKSYVKFLETECTTKNKQLDNKDDIIKNMQVLLENEQEIVSSHVNLEDRCREMDDKLFQLKGQLENRQKKHKKSFLKKLFKM